MSAIERIVDVCGTTIDLHRVVMVSAGYKSPVLRYTIHTDGGHSLTFWDEKFEDQEYFPRAKFVNLWRQYEYSTRG